MTHVNFSYHYAERFFSPSELDALMPCINQAHDHIEQKTGLGKEFLGWVNLPKTYDRTEFSRIQTVAETIRDDSDVFIVIGVGGSYLGARAALEMLSHSFHNILPKEKRQAPQIFFVGHHLNSTYINELFDVLKQKDVSINVVSKSGKTTEPAIAFRIFKKFLERKYGTEEAKQRIYVTTDRKNGPLKSIANEEGYETFVIPDDVGGRYSVLTAVGLLPIAVGGICIDEMMKGAQRAMVDLQEPFFDKNPAYQYAALRHILYNRGKTTEILVHYEPRLRYFAEWWKQLFGESEGKDLKGIFPTSAEYTTDLHAMGQYIQEGRRNLFETVLHVRSPRKNVTLEKDSINTDDLNYLAGKTIHDINNKAYQAALLAHTEGGVPNLTIELPQLDAFTFGYLVYFFEKSCAMSGYLLGVNPFNQPGVEAYKRNMYALLDKPGYEKEKRALEKQLKQ
ncbi:MAG TPA: glucose-6-phosphate isomerase [Bacillota bacterium]|nr:glucose-6-phosphate isomerase [Bacillota bacterium]